MNDRSRKRDHAAVRLSVNISAPVADALRTVRNRHGTSVTEEVRRALSIYKFLDDYHVAGHRILVEKDGDFHEVFWHA